MEVAKSVVLTDAESISSSLEAWSKEVFHQLHAGFDVKHCTLVLYVDDALHLAATSIDGSFQFFPEFNALKADEDYLFDFEHLYTVHKERFSFITDIAFNASWKEDGVWWEKAIIPLNKKEERLGYLLIESPRKAQTLHFKEGDFLWVRRNAENVLRCKLFNHLLEREQIANRRNELDLALNNRSLTSQMNYLKSLHEISLRFTKASTIHSLCRIAIELGREKLQIDRMAIFLCDMETMTMYGTWGTDPNGNVVDRTDFEQRMPDNLFMEEAFARKNELIVKENVPLYFGTTQVGVGWNLMMAMWHGDECIGWIAADNLLYGSQLDDPKKEAVKLLAASVCQKILKLRETEMANQRLEALVCEREALLSEVAQLKKKVMHTQSQLQRINAIEPKTGLLSSAYLADTYSGFVSDAKQNKQMLAVFSIGVDDFRDYRKVYGEVATHNLVVKLANVLEQVLESEKTNQLTYHKPGEFIVLIVHSNNLLMRELAERILASVYQLNLPNQSSKYFHRVTVSIGVALDTLSLLPSHRNALKKAQKLKNTAVGLGKNRVCID